MIAASTMAGGMAVGNGQVDQKAADSDVSGFVLRVVRAADVNATININTAQPVAIHILLSMICAAN